MRRAISGARGTFFVGVEIRRTTLSRSLRDNRNGNNNNNENGLLLFAAAAGTLYSNRPERVRNTAETSLVLYKYAETGQRWAGPRPRFCFTRARYRQQRAVQRGRRFVPANGKTKNIARRITKQTEYTKRGRARVLYWRNRAYRSQTMIVRCRTYHVRTNRKRVPKPLSDYGT